MRNHLAGHPRDQVSPYLPHPRLRYVTEGMLVTPNEWACRKMTRDTFQTNDNPDLSDILANPSIIQHESIAAAGESGLHQWWI